jgi:hypothetical protein
MDFKSLISKLDSMEAPPETPRAPKLPEKVQLDEDAELRVLAGTSTILAEAEIMEKKLTKAEKEKKEEVVKSMKKDKAGFKERYGKRGEEVMHATATKIAKKKAESVEEAASWLDPLKAAQGAMSSVKKDPESERNKDKPYGYRSDKAVDDDNDDMEHPKDRKGKKKAKKESIDTEQFRDKFFSLVEAKKKEAEKKMKGKKAEEKMDEAAKPDFLDVDKDGDKKEPMKKAAKEAGKGEKKDAKKGMSAKQAKYFGKKKSVKESFFEDDDDYPDTGEGPEDLLDAVESEIRNPGQRIDNLVDVLNATFGSDNSPEFEKARRIIEKYIELVTTADMDHYDDDDDDRTNPAIAAMDHDDIQRHIREYDLTDRLQHAAAMLDKIIAKGESYQFRESANAKKKSKKYMKESVEPKMTFRDMMKLVVESGGQQQIDPLDKELFNWATRVANNKLGEGMKAEVYAGLVYERMGGRFEMFDVLSENKK